MSKYNEELFRQVLTLIKHDRSLWNQETFRQPSYASSCGTTCCIAGWAVVVKHGEFIPINDSTMPYTGRWVLPPNFERNHDFELEGARLLGLNGKEAADIFFFISDHSRNPEIEDDEYLDEPPHVTFNQMVKRIMKVTGLDFSDLLDSEEVAHDPYPATVL